MSTVISREVFEFSPLIRLLGVLLKGWNAFVAEIIANKARRTAKDFMMELVMSS